MRDAACLAAILALGLFALWFGWVGYIESDDGFYAQAALGWLSHFPYLPDGHWGLRHLIVLPIAASFLAFGVHEWSLVLPVCGYYLLLLAVTYLFVAGIVDRGTGILAASMVALLPLFSTFGSTVVTDIAETFFVVCSWGAFYLARRRGAPIALLLAAGVFSGLAFLTRETSVVVIVFYGLHFLLDREIPRQKYFVIAAGFLIVFGIDITYLGILSGDPLYRFHVSMRGIAADNPSIATLAGLARDGLDRHGVIVAPRIVQPVLMLLTSPQFGLLFWAAIPAAIVAMRGRVTGPARGLALSLGALGLLWFVILSYAMPFLWIEPRYQSILAFAAAILVALWLGRGLGGEAPRLAAILVAAIFASDLGLTYLHNNDLLFGERALVGFAASQPEPIYTDPATRASAAFLLLSAGIAADRVTSDQPPQGALFLYNSAPRRPASGAAAAPFAPPASWTLLDRVEEQPRLGARLLRMSGLESQLPAGVAHKLDPPPHRADLYRVN